MLILVMLAAAASADTLHLKGGDKIEGEILSDQGDALRLRTLNGIVDIDKDRIIKRVEGPAPWKVYKNKRKACPDTASGHYQLAQWCREHGLAAEARTQLERVIQLEPNHEEARRTLGYVKEGGQWVRPRVGPSPTPAEQEADRAAREEEQLVRGLVAKWFVKIRAIYQGRMAREKQGMASGKFRQARETILSFRDPFAIPALAGVLSTGHVAARRVMVEALARFSEDEAAMNLLIVAVLDPAAEIRQLAAQALVQRPDERLAPLLRQALQSEEEFVLRNAASALGIMKERSVVEDLIQVLTVEREGIIRISRPIFLDGVLVGFGDGERYQQGKRMVYYHPVGIGVLGPGTMVGTATRYETGPITVHRTEVQEALIAITGQNFGFDAEAWWRWWREKPP